MRCVICEKLLMKNRDPDEMTRLLQAGVFELRQVQLSYGLSDKGGKKVQHYPVCSDCVRKEQAEEEEMEQ